MSKDYEFAGKVTVVDHLYRFQVPNPVGSFEILPRYYFEVQKKPNAWRRFWLRALLGWRWEDA